MDKFAQANTRTNKGLTQLGLAVLVCALLSSCGWQLRGTVSQQAGQTVNQISTLNVVSENRNNAFFRSFQEALTRQKISLSSSAPIMLQLSREQQERKPQSYNKNGVPAQYQLILEIDFQASRDGKTFIEQRRLISRRTYDFDPNLIIAKDREQEQLLDEMRKELANRILNALATES